MLLDFLRRLLISRPAAYARRLKTAWLAQLRAHARRQPLWSNTVLYESFGANGALDNPEAIFRRLLDRDDHATTKHIWALKPGTGREFRREFRSNARVRFVKYRSRAYFAAISRATYLVNNATFPTEFGKRPGQVYLNTWHGTPLKLMGYDMPDGAVKSANVMRNLLSADILLSQNPWMTENMYNRGYKLEGFYRGSILELGYPRTDIHFTHTGNRDELRARLGVTDPKQQLIMYAPTWTGENFSDPRMEAEELLASVNSLQRALGPDYVVRLKAHQLVHGLVKSHPDAARVLVDNDLPTNAVLDVSDQLVTDFSSIFFDFLAVDRPISYLVLPESNYLDERGTYIPQSELPGPVLQSVPELAERVRQSKDPYEKTRREWAGRFIAHGDGKASDRAIDAMFAPPARQDPEPTGDRSRLLIYSGGMRSNGITSSLLNLLASLDHESWDVTLLSGWPRGQARRNHGHVDPRVRQLFRVGGMNGGKLSILRFQLRERRKPDRVLSAGDATIWREEISRLLADNHFDVALDFSGYSRFWTQVLLHLPAKRRAIWLHNDMAAEVFRPVNGKLAMKRTLPSVFQLYKHFDELVSVSPRLSELNRENLAEKYGLQADHFTYARNMIDVDRIRRSSAVSIDNLLEVQDEEYDTSWLGRLEEPNTFWFITLGRLSPEKNQARLIDAFDRVHQQHPETRLLIVGDGPLMDELKTDVHRRGLDGVAILSGAFGNPFPLLKRGNCFVLSSNYEGQPMVLLEAATLGLPIVTTRFGSAEDALPPGTAIVTDLDAAGLADGMVKQLEKPLTYEFDPDAYNAMVLGETERIISSLEPSPHRHPHADAAR